MKQAPNKIYAYIPDDDVIGTASLEKGKPHQFVTTEYIRKDFLLEWIEVYINDIKREDYQGFAYRAAIAALTDVSNQINSL